MKMFKKLMAVALAGVMALAVLTGCGSSVNEKEVIAVINDAIKAPLGKVVEDETGEKNVEITFKAADSELKNKTKAVAGIVEEKIGEKDTIDTILTSKKEATEPDTTFVADNGIADEYCIIGEETVFTDFRGKSPY